MRTLIEAGFEGYVIDYRRANATYVLPSAGSVELRMPKTDGLVAAEWKEHDIEQAVREAQTKAPRYTYASKHFQK